MVRAGIPADCNLYAIISYIQRDGCIATLGRSNLKNQTRESWWDMKKLALGDKISIHVTDEIGEESLPMKIEPAKLRRGSGLNWIALCSSTGIEKRGY